MAKTNEKVMEAVKAALKKDPATSVDDLFAVAKGVSPAVGKLSKRQFHARYPLQVKRKLNAGKRPRRARKKAAAKRRRTGAAPASGAAHEAVRRTFLRFASDLAAAEARKDVVRVVADVDRYVAEALKAAKR